jgi:ornithine carbamoyltransferase
MPKDVLRIADLSRGQILSILDLASDLKHHPLQHQRELAGELVLLYITEPSTRTRVTFASGAARLGATVVVVGPAELTRGQDTLDDIARAVGGYATAIVARTDEVNLQRLATLSTTSVVNGMSERHHPAQGLADLLTLREAFGPLAGRRVAYIGDGANVCHSLLEACALTGVDLRLTAPPGREPQPEVLERAGALAARSGSTIMTTYDATEAVAGVDAVYIGPWLAGEPPDDDQSVVSSYPVTPELLDHASPEAIVLHNQSRTELHPGLHGLPGLDGLEAYDLGRDPRSRGREQAENRLHVASALLVAFQREQLRTEELAGDLPTDLTTAPQPANN